MKVWHRRLSKSHVYFSQKWVTIVKSFTVFWIIYTLRMINWPWHLTVSDTSHVSYHIVTDKKKEFPCQFIYKASSTYVVPKVQLWSFKQWHLWKIPFVFTSFWDLWLVLLQSPGLKSVQRTPFIPVTFHSHVEQWTSLECWNGNMTFKSLLPYCIVTILCQKTEG